ncbi:hypothetical protein HQO38_18615 [Rhodococcus fascians]|nr:hypothetical protein [Rhodococcus fascians]MBY4140954.1 hypothetical protein [Rhodococcus fascians]MBY4219618.1 hypothetical protein [Rhodococcus fascians]MBY4221927.1 hypothetical protein [Rhodococcus fascians]MBY4233928.1 hypothetical protein [Rhodococcus fascians]
MKIANSIGDVTVAAGAADSAEIIAVLKDLDAQRIAKSDDIVIRKGMLALLDLVGRLEQRIVDLERVTADVPAAGEVRSA